MVLALHANHGPYRSLTRLDSLQSEETTLIFPIRKMELPKTCPRRERRRQTHAISWNCKLGARAVSFSSH